MDKSELRMDPLTREWTIFNENRAVPPPAQSIADVLPASPFRAGLERFASRSLFQSGGPVGWQVRVVPNRTPVLAIEADPGMKQTGIYRHICGFGAHEIVIEDPGERRFAEIGAAGIAHVVEAWRSRIEDLTRDGRMFSFFVIKNEGAAAGQVVAHSISQIVTMGLVSPALRRKLNVAKEYHAAHATSLFADVLAEELKTRTRVVFENAGFVGFCPYAARSPFEISIWPKRLAPDFHRITNDEVSQLAEALNAAVGGIRRGLGAPAWNLALTTAPSVGARAEEWPDVEREFSWHIDVTPRLYPAGALEQVSGCHVNGVWPETAADFLRRQEARP